MDYSKTETGSWRQINNMNTVNYSMNNMFVNNDNCIVPLVVLKLDYWHIIRNRKLCESPTKTQIHDTAKEYWW